MNEINVKVECGDSAWSGFAAFHFYIYDLKFYILHSFRSAPFSLLQLLCNWYPSLLKHPFFPTDIAAQLYPPT